ncbi:uncharacterized protein LOC111647034 [Seriola lalandi dorsalis]|uniref:uncharacterized protein LOC111647034 n=1 Tax=Seriola lalandi dorsalis TaxID=1841481 RepID=UPI000C6FC1B0|nr:uncharacterized protein LOC111647034 [Seriola lalandi dorsalis]
MTPPVFALYATCLLCLGRIADTTASKLSSSLHFVSVNVGEKVTLECFYKESATAVMFYWYKQTLGEKPRLVSKFYKHEKNGILQDDFKNNSRFELESTTGKNHLKISDVQMSDSATYYCVSSFSYVYEFLESITVTVKGSGLNNQSWIRQSAFEILQPGGSVTLNCTVHTGTCDGEHSVYWFKDSKESHPGLIYTHGDRNDQCERKPETQTQTCVYNLPMQRLNRSHAGTYYCAVASCGHILFGNGTKLEFEDEVKSVVLVYLLSGALAFNAVLVVVLAYIMYKANSCQCTDSQARSAAARAPSTEGHRDADELHYAALREHKASSSRRQRDDTMSECVYSSVKQ